MKNYFKYLFVLIVLSSVITGIYYLLLQLSFGETALYVCSSIITAIIFGFISSIMINGNDQSSVNGFHSNL